MTFNDFNPGELNKLIHIVKYEQSAAKDDDGFDSNDSVKTVVRTCYAKVSDESGTKALASGTEFSVSKRRFLVRFTPVEITTDMFVEYKGETYSIVRPPNAYGDSGRFIEIWTKLRKMV